MMKLWYNNTATEWTEAMPIGNGHMGAMCYGGAEGRFDLSENTCWSGRKQPDSLKPGAGEAMKKARTLLLEQNYEEAEQILEDCRGIKGDYGSQVPMGRLFLSVEATPEQTTRSLDLLSGVAADVLQFADQKVTRKSFLSNPAKVMGVELMGETVLPPLRLWLEGWSQPSHTQWDRGEKAFVVGRALENIHGDGLHGVRYVMGLRFLTDGEISWNRRGLLIENASKLTVFLTASTDMFDEKPEDTCEKRLATAVEDGFEKLLTVHIADHSAGMGKCSFTMPDDQATLPTDVRVKAFAGNPEGDLGLIPLFFQYGRYLIFNSSRPDSLLPAALQGVWNDDRACRMEWTDDMHLDINTQMNYYPAENTGLGDCVEPLFRWIKEVLVPSGMETAKTLYGGEGWCAHTVSNAYGWSVPGWDVGWGMDVACGGWVAYHIWEHYLYTKDRDFLEEYYDVLYQCAKFLKSVLMEEPRSGKLLTVPSYSPENVFLWEGKGHSITAGSTFDTNVTRTIFEVVEKAAEILGKEDDFTASLAETAAKLPDYQIGKHGQLQEWFYDYDEAYPDHRHTSHLLATHPFNRIDPAKEPALKQAMETTLIRRLGENAKDIVYANWAGALLITYYARLLDGEKAGNFVKPMIAFLSRPNMMITHQGPTTSVTGGIYELDGNTGFTAAVGEMLMQSYGGVIRILPAIPKSWSTGAVTGMRCFGGHEVDFAWDETSVSVKLRTGFPERVMVRAFGEEQTVEAEKGQEYALNFACTRN